MTLDEFVKSTDFQVFLDETLRREAIRAAEMVLARGKKVKRHQMHVIPSVIQAAGLDGLRKLADRQKDKNTRQENKAFWIEIHSLLSSDTSELSLLAFLQSFLRERGFLDPVEQSQDKVTQKQIRKRDKQITEGVMESIIGVYFEHFNCHYYYKTSTGGER
jgi:uncharacterized protein YihD (DUF1040 family)